MATTVPSNAAVFGVTGTEETLQSRSVTTRVDKQVIKDKDGDDIGIAYHGKMADHELSLANVTALAAYTLGAVSTAPTEITTAFTGTVTTVFCVDEVSLEKSNESWNTGTVRVSEYLIDD